VAGEDEILMEKYLRDEEISQPELIAAIRRTTIANKLVPIF